MSEHIAELQETIVDLINAHIESEFLTRAEIIGVLEIVKLDIYAQEEEDEDE